MATRNASEPAPARQLQAERTDASRQTLIDATITLLAEEGYRAATVNRIQEISGLSRGLVGYHFGSKSQLMEAVVDDIRLRYLRETGQTKKTTASGLDQVLRMFDVYFTRLEANPEPAKVMLVLATETAAGGSEVAKRVMKAFADVRSRIATMLRTGVEDGSIRSDVEPDAHALILHGVLRGIVMQYLIDPESCPIRPAKQATLSMLKHDLASR